MANECSRVISDSRPIVGTTTLLGVSTLGMDQPCPILFR
jgi:hypothetical protein